MATPYRNPVVEHYFADPFVLAVDGSYVAIGTGAVVGQRIFEVLTSSDLVHWTQAAGALLPPGGDVAAEIAAERAYWAPEVVQAHGRFWMYYSVGVRDTSHHLRVAVADCATGPYVDCGVDLTPAERFAIDPNPVQGEDGTWYLFYARDVLDTERVGTMLAVDVLDTMTSLRGHPVPVLEPSADWQIYERQRWMYGRRYDWHTLEGPCVVRRAGRWHLLYSGGAWMAETYALGHAVADHPLGPWTQPQAHRPMLGTVPGRVIGPGHCSIVQTPTGRDVLAYHAWDPALTARRMFLDPIAWTEAGPVTDAPTWTDTILERDLTGRGRLQDCAS